jgi:sugar lactone lactonase YvrE
MPIVLRLLLALAALVPTLTFAHEPVLGSLAVFASGVPGPEGLAFSDHGVLFVGTQTGQVLQVLPDGSQSVVADTGEPLAGLTVLRDHRILAAAFGAARVWSIDAKTGTATVFASGIPGANFVVQTRSGHIYASASTAGTIVEITTGTPVVRASALLYPNGLALFRGSLYVAELTGNRVSRLPIAIDGTLGAPVVFATGISLVDGIAFDREGNLFAVGTDMLHIVRRGSSTPTFTSNDPLLNWPSNIAFGRGHGFGRRDVFLANYGLPLGSGVEILRVSYNHQGSRLIR